MLKWMLIFLIGFSFCVPGSGQEKGPYHFDFARESKYIVGGGIAYGLATILQEQAPVFNSKSILELEQDDMLALDRGVIYNSNHGHEKFSDYLLNGSFALPLLLLTQENTRNDFGQISLLYLETVMISGGITNLTKSTFIRPRPYVYNEFAPEGKKYTQNARRSFISGHTSLTATNAFFMAKVFHDYFPDSKLEPYVWATAALIPAVTGYLRVSSGNHFPTDVVAGYLIGGSIGFLVPHLHKIPIGRKGYLDINGGPGQISMNIKF